MKIQTNVLNDKEIQSTGTVKKMKLDDSSQAMIFQMFTGGLYSDPIGTVIREIASNCFDSHVEANVDSIKNPVIIRLTSEVSGSFISFIDKGVGMSPDRVENIYGNYFKSTKRQTNNQIGGFGLGGKTPLAYTSSFFLITRFDGIEYIYNVFEGNETPAFELMSQSSTKLCNGTEVKIPVKASDVNEFERKTLRQLYYFENIVFEGFSDYYVTNDYNIIKGKNFLYRGTNYSDLMHVCLGKVAYPIDFEILDLDKENYRIPVAINIGIGELEGAGVTPSREALKYSPENIKIIKTKIDLVMEELGDMLSKQMDNVRTIKDYYQTMDNFGHLYLTNNDSIYLGAQIKKSDVVLNNFKYNDVRIPLYSDLIGTFYHHKMYGKKGTRYGRSRTPQYKQTFGSAEELSNIVHTKGEFKRVVLKQSYLQHIHTNFHLHTPIDFSNDDDMAHVLRMLGLAKLESKKKSANRYTIDLDDEMVLRSIVPKNKAIKLVKALAKEVYDWMSEVSDDYDELVVPEEYIELRKKKRISNALLNEGVNMKIVSSSWGSGTSTSIKFEQLLKFEGRIYYGFRDDVDELRYAYRIQKDISGVKSIVDDWDFKISKMGKGTLFMVISKANEKSIKLLGRKAMHVKYFYHTYVSRKMDKIVYDRAIYNINHNFDRNVLDIFKKDYFDVIDQEIYDNVQAVKNDLVDAGNTHSSIRDYKFKDVFNKTLDEINITIDSIDKLNWLIDLSLTCEGKFTYIRIPYEVDMTKKSDQHLVELLRLCIK